MSAEELGRKRLRQAMKLPLESGWSDPVLMLNAAVRIERLGSVVSRLRSALAGIVVPTEFLIEGGFFTPDGPFQEALSAAQQALDAAREVNDDGQGS